MIKYLIDTNILIDYLKGLDDACNFINESLKRDIICYISTINIAELYAGVRKDKEENDLEKFLQGFEIVHIDSKIARTGGLYRRDYGKSHGVCIADALIAACATTYDLQLITLNTKHFPMLENINSPY